MMNIKGSMPFLSLLLLVTLGVLLLAEADEVRGLTEIFQDVTIDHDASWAGDTLRIHGNLTVQDGYTLDLDNAVVEIAGTANATNWLEVQPFGVLRATGSTIRGSPFTISMVLDGSTDMEDCTIENVWSGNMSHGIQLSGHAKLVRTSVRGVPSGTGINVTGSLEAVGCTFTDQGDVTILFNDPSMSRGSSLVNSTFEHPTASTPTTYGVAVLWPSTLTVDQGLTVSGCVFEGLDLGIFAEIDTPRVFINISGCQFLRCEKGYSVRGNEASTSIIGCSIEGVGTTGLEVEVPDAIDDPLDLTVRDLVIKDYSDGVYISGPVMDFMPVLENVSITDCVNGVRVKGSTVLVEDSVVLDCGVCFYVESKSRIEIRRTEHTYQSAEIALGQQAAVVAFSTVHVASCRWQNGLNLTTGELILYGDDTVELTRLDLSALAPVEVVVWSLTRFNELGRLFVVPVLRLDGIDFEAAEFSIYETNPQDVELVDHLPPEVEVLSPLDGDWLASTVVEVTGRVSDQGSGVYQVGVRYRTGVWAYTEVFNEGLWSIEFDMGSEGPFSLTVRVIDNTDGNTTVVVGNLTVDSITPSLEPDWEEALVNVTWVNVTGVTEPFAFVEARATDMPPDSPYLCVNNTTASNDGLFDIYLCMPAGWHDVSLTSTDRAGNNISRTLRIGMDPQWPALQVLTPSRGSWLNTTEVMVSGTFSDGGVSSWVRCWVDGDLVEGPAGDFEVVLEIAEGSHTITVRVEDEAGNVRVVKRAVQVDLTPPRLRIVTPTEDRFFTDEARIEMQGDVTDLNLDLVTLNGEELAVIRDIVTASLLISDGENVFLVTAVDKAGNTVTRTLTIIRDHTPPTYTMEVALPEGTTTEIDGSMYATYDGQGVPSLMFSFQVSENSTVVASGGLGQVQGEGVLEISLALDEGENSFTFNIMDESGNAVAPLTYNIILDTTPPVIDMTDPRGEVETKDPVYRIRGRVEAGSSLTVNGGLVEVNDDGTFSIQVDLEVGENVFKLEVEDVVGLTNGLEVTIIRKKEADEGPAPGAVAALVGLLAAAMVSRSILRRRG